MTLAMVPGSSSVYARPAGMRLSVVLVLLMVILVAEHAWAPAAAAKSDLSAGEFKCPRCDVILLNIELLRADHVGLISGGKLTPAIDRFFRNGLILHDVSAPAGETFLSNTAVLTFTPPHRIETKAISIDQFDQLETAKQASIEAELSQLRSVAEALREQGYATVGINQGGRAGEHVYLDRGFQEFQQWSSRILFEDLASLLIEELAKARDNPLFLLFRPTFLHQQQYRRPSVPDSLDREGVRVSRYTYGSTTGARKSAVLLRRERQVDIALEKAAERRIYAGQLRYGDRELARIFEILEKHYVDKAIIVLYSNHGSGLGDNGIFRHGTSYQASIHVPVLIRLPGLRRPAHVDAPLSLLDLVPTLYRMLGMEKQLQPVVATYDEAALGQGSDEVMLVGRNSWDEYIRLGDWKLIIEYDRIKSLFDLAADPGEKHNLYDVERMRARKLESILLQYKRDLHQ